MAGAGFKTWVDGDILTAADVNTYLMEQAVMVFADSAARTTALTAPTEGMITFLKDTNKVEYYDGAAWQWLSPVVWTTFTPSWNNFTPGNAVETWKYCIVDKLIIVSGRTVLGSTSVMGTQPTMTLPASATAAIYSHGVLRVGDNDGEIYQGSCILAGPADTTIGLQIYRVVSTNVASAQINATTPMTWTTNDNLSFTIIGDIT